MMQSGSGMMDSRRGVFLFASCILVVVFTVSSQVLFDGPSNNKANVFMSFCSNSSFRVHVGPQESLEFLDCQESRGFEVSQAFQAHQEPLYVTV